MPFGYEEDSDTYIKANTKEKDEKFVANFGVYQIHRMHSELKIKKNKFQL